MPIEIFSHCVCFVMAGICRQTFTVDALAIRYWMCRWSVCVCVYVFVCSFAVDPLVCLTDDDVQGGAS